MSPPEIKELAIKGVLLLPLARFSDHRGWLCETFRPDWFSTAGIPEPRPVMTYISSTLPGEGRGPHEHRLQRDLFAFLGPSDFLVYLWDNRSDSPTKNVALKLTLGESNPGLILIPPGVVHGYRNIGPVPGLVLNHPDRLYRGWGRVEPVDEIRYEDHPDSPFRME